MDDSASSMSRVFSAATVAIPDGYGLPDELTYRDGAFHVDLLLSDGDSYFTDKGRKRMTFSTAGEILDIVAAESVGGTETWRIGDSRLEIDGKYNLTCPVKNTCTVSLPELFHYDIEADLSVGWRSDAIFEVLNVTSDGTDFYILTTKGICALTANMEVRWVLEENGTPCALACCGEELYYLYDTSEEKRLAAINKSDGSELRSLELPDEIRNGRGSGSSGASMQSLPGDSSCDFYLSTRVAVYRVNIEKEKNGKEVCRAEEYLNWMNSGISPVSVEKVCLGGENTAAVIRSSGDEKILQILTKVQDAAQEKKTLSLALLTNDNAFSPILYRAVEEADLSDAGYQLEVRDYTVYDDELMTTFLYAEIAAGHSCDAVILSSDAETNVYTMSRNGLFCDLLPMLKENTDFDDDGLLGYCTRPYLQDGRQTVFPLTPTYRTRFGPSEMFSSVPTAEETVEMLRSVSAGSYWAEESPAWTARSIIEGCMMDYIDQEQAKCSFDDGSFAGILDMLGGSGDDYTRPDGLDTPYERMLALMSGKLYTVEYDLMALADYAALKYVMGSTPVPVGYPNRQGLRYVRDGGVYYAVTKEGEGKQEAVDFLNRILEGHQNAKYNRKYLFFEKDILSQYEELKDKTIVLADHTMNGFTHSDTAENVSGYRVTEEDARDFIDCLNTVDAILPVNTPFYQIYIEECYGSSERSAEQIAAAIQSRIGIYLAETDR